MRTVVLIVLIVSVVGREDTPSKATQGRLKECGTPSLTGPHGAAFPVVEHPWQVEIFGPLGYYRDMLTCEGALLNERYVLTAATCVHGTVNSELRVTLGDFDIEGYTTEDFKVRRKIIHEHFTRTDGSDYLNNIALLELHEAVRFDYHIRPICLPEQKANFNGEAAKVVGWKALHLSEYAEFEAPSEMQTEVEIDKNDLCSAWFAAEYNNRSIPETSLCARPKLLAQGPCRDGSPLIVNRDGRAQVVGISSGVPPSACSKLPVGPTKILTVYTNVTNYVDWINVNMRGPSKSKIGHLEEFEEDTLLRSLEAFRGGVGITYAGAIVFVVLLIAALIGTFMILVKVSCRLHKARDLRRQLAAAIQRPRAPLILNDSFQY